MVHNQAVLPGAGCTAQADPLDAETGLMVGDGDVAVETRQVLKNLVAVLNAAGASPAQVVRTTVFLADLADFQTVNKIYAEVFAVASAQRGHACRWPHFPRSPR